MRALPALLLLAGCSLIGADFSDDGGGPDGPSAVDFAQAYAEARCAWFDTCGYLAYAGGTVEACIDTQTEAMLNMVQDEACAYDPEAAQDCLDELGRVDCKGQGESSGSDPCARVCGEPEDTGDTGPVDTDAAR